MNLKDEENSLVWLWLGEEDKGLQKLLDFLIYSYQV